MLLRTDPLDGVHGSRTTHLHCFLERRASAVRRDESRAVRIAGACRIPKLLYRNRLNMRTRSPYQELRTSSAFRNDEGAHLLLKGVVAPAGALAHELRFILVREEHLCAGDTLTKLLRRKIRQLLPRIDKKWNS